MQSYRIASIAAACLSVGLVAQAQAAVTVPYAADFTQGQNSDFQFGGNSAGATWLTPTAAGWEADLAGTGWGAVNQTNQVVDTGGAVAGTSFLVTTHFQFTTLNSAWGGVGVAIGALVANPGTLLGGGSTASCYTAGLYAPIANGQTPTYSLGISGNDGSWYGASLASGPVSSVSTGVQYTMQLAGSYDANGALTLTLTLTDPSNNTTSATATPITSPGQGTFFGLSSYVDNEGAGSVVFQDFSITNSVPEPATAGLLAVGALGLLARRRAR